MTRITATVLLSLGSFGSEAAALLRRRLRASRGDRPADLGIIDVDAQLLRGGEPGLADVADRLAAEVAEQLALCRLVERPAEDGALPWLDVLLVGDLAEPEVRAALGSLIATVGRVAAERFPGLLGRGASRVVAIPVLALERPKDQAERDASIALLSGLARPGSMPRTRTLLLEAQTARYLLSRGELVSSAVGILEILVLAELRDHVQIAPFLRGSPPRGATEGAAAPVFGTFGVASVRVAADLVRDYCRNRAALAIVESMRSGPEVGLAQREELAREARIPWDDLRERLGVAVQSEAALEQVEKVVRAEAPEIVSPPIDLDDTPEQIRDDKYGEDWLAGVRRSIEDLEARLDQRRIPELVAQIDQNGLRAVRERRRWLNDWVDRVVWKDPRGWAAARSCLRLLRDEAIAREREARLRVGGRLLHDLPGADRLLPKVAALRAETERRPRPQRMWVVGPLAAVPAAVLGSLALNGAAAALEGLAPAWVQTVLGFPWGLSIAATVSCAALWLYLRSFRRDRHDELCEVRDDLERGLERLVVGKEGSIVSCHTERLSLACDLWVLRMATAERSLVEGLVERLDEVQRALDSLREELRAAQRRLGVRYGAEGTGEDLEAIQPASDLILREAVDGRLLRAAYREAVADETGLSDAFFARLRDEKPQWRGQVPMAELARVERVLDDAVAVPGPASLLGRGADPDDEAGGAIRAAIEAVLRDLSTRLSPPLELDEAAVEGHVVLVICSPEAASEVVDVALGSLRVSVASALGAGWLRLSSPRDDGRIYLAAVAIHLPLEAIGALRP